jgi:lipopolysaccharide/colanic/teichoic acid biosynthesis glycosyltransferase
VCDFVRLILFTLFLHIIEHEIGGLYWSPSWIILPESMMGRGLSVALDRARNIGQMPRRLVETRRRLRQRRTYNDVANKLTVREPSNALLAAKRTLDIVGSGIGLLLFAPLLIGIAIAIKITSPGPIFFRQKRYGYHNRRFLIYKFRTMYIHLSDYRGTRQVTGGDLRITPLGRILRKTSLDELPQLINVLIGDMSLVGPRPHVPGMLAGGLLYEELTPYYFQRHNMRPGISGLAQVSGHRGETTAPHLAIERLDRDLQYIERWSLHLDLSIILRTLIREFTSGSGT